MLIIEKNVVFFENSEKGLPILVKLNLTTILNYQVHEAGITTGLPHHRSSCEEIEHLMKLMECFLKTLPPPALITVAR